jgi:glycerol-3-phosphate dehydrogenase
LHIRLVQKYDVGSTIAKRLAAAYGGRAHDVIAIAKSMGPDGLERILVPNFPILEAEVIFAARHEWAVHPEDVLARRTRLAFVNKAAAVSAIPKVVELMGNELQWTKAQRQAELQRCVEYMRTFGGPTPLPGAEPVRMSTDTDIKHAFREIDTDKFGFLTSSQIPLTAEILHHPLTDKELEDLLVFAKGQGCKTGQVSLVALTAWWNSDRLNPGLVELRKNKLNTENIEGAGAFFG